MKKILILTTHKKNLVEKTRFKIASHSYWGMFELLSYYDNVQIKNVKSLFANSWIFLHEDFDVLYMHNWDPVRFMPIHILKFLFPCVRNKKVICLCHASIYGKSHLPSKWAKIGWIIAWITKGYDKLLFFSPKSMEESIDAGVDKDKCSLIHWGADLSFLSLIENNKSTTNFWLSTGKENRDFCTMEVAKSIICGKVNLQILNKGVSYYEIALLTKRCSGVIVIPNKNGLNYCTGLTCIMEAFAFGKPIVAVRNPYYPFDLEEIGCGLYVDEEAPKQVAEAILKIESDDHLYRRMCTHSQEMSLKYNMDSFMKELKKEIDS